MRRLFEWYYGLSPSYQAPIRSLYFGIWMGTFVGLALGNLGTAFAAMLFGVIVLGPVFSFREWRDDARTAETVDDYPEELKEVERRHAGHDLILMPILIVTGIAASWIIFGTGWYGLLGGIVATFVVSWTSARFGGPSDPRWKKLRDDWRSQRGQRGQASG